MGVFDQLIQLMIDMGVFEVLLPWLFVLSITYGALQKYEVFEEEAVNGAVALSFAFMASGGIVIFNLGTVFSNFMAAIAFAVMGVISVVILAAVAGFDFSEIEDKESNELIGASLVLVIIAFIGSMAYQLNLEGLIPSDNVWQDAVMPAVILLFFLLFASAMANAGDSE